MKQRRFARLPVLVVVFGLLGGLLLPTLDALAVSKTTKTAVPKAAPKARFALALDTAVVTVPRGSGATATVLLTRNGTFVAPVRLSATARRGLTFTFDDNPLSGDDTDLTVSASPIATLGSTTITVTGRSGSSAVRLLVRVRVVPALAAGVTTTTPVAGTPTVTPAGVTTTAAAATTTAAPGVTTTTVAGTTTTTPSTSSTTATAGATTTTTTARPLTSTSTTVVSLAPKLGDLVVVRRLSQSPRCNVDVTAGPLVSFQVRAEASDALVSFVPVNTCTETPVANRLFVGSNSSQALNLVGGTLMIVRSTAAGNPIRRVLRVTTATDPVVRLGETLIFFMSCNPPPGPAGSLPVTPNVPFVVSLAAQGQFVLNDVPAGHYCDVKPSSSYTYAGAAEDTTEPIGDSFVVVPDRSSSCPKATLTTPVPGPVGCYAEMVITN